MVLEIEPRALSILGQLPAPELPWKVLLAAEVVSTQLHFKWLLLIFGMYIVYLEFSIVGIRDLVGVQPFPFCGYECPFLNDL